jgi:hypothetical protein
MIGNPDARSKWVGLQAIERRDDLNGLGISVAAAIIDG